MGFGHAIISAEDARATFDFYVDVLGFVERNTMRSPGGTRDPRPAPVAIPTVVRRHSSLETPVTGGVSRGRRPTDLPGRPPACRLSL